ncbi:ATP-dependent protease ClpP protease subunit [Azospirillum agricola]|uniref:head maturation protease, ClpP-related n=1 Tax=Azospirillum agricola TaxID=1720247 RepID=UPI001F1E9289|nr:head maturation protease, ClpP-related [Azospirillum agricola]MBP2229656.1 ATP-dependent protease ClpP protease subunit [Azospirillum agricola]
MPKPLIDAALLTAGRAMNRAPVALGPGHVRVAADEAASEAEVYIYGDIGGWWDGIQAEEFAKEIGALDVDTINVRLNSPGGVVFDGVAIYQALARHKANVVIHIDGIAASIASVIAMAGDEIRIVEGANVMIHKPWSFAIGDAVAMRKEGEILDKLESGIIDIYAARTGQERQALVDWVGAETWFSAAEAKDAGFADTVVPAKGKGKDKKAAHARSAMLPLFQRTPKDLLPEASSGAPAIREFERLLRDGEGFSHAQARRVAALARAFTPGHRDDDQHQPPPAPRDEDGQAADVAALARLTNTLKTLSR